VTSKVRKNDYAEHRTRLVRRSERASERAKPNRDKTAACRLDIPSSGLLYSSTRWLPSHKVRKARSQRHASRDVAWHRASYVYLYHMYHAIQKESNDHSVYRRHSEQPSRTCIASRSSIVIFSVVHFPPFYLSPLAQSISFSRYSSFSLSPSFSRALALTPSLSVTDTPTPLSHTLSLHENACSRRNLRTVTRIHFLTRMSTSEVPRARRTRRHGVYTILRPLLRVFRYSSPLSFSLSLSPSLSLLRIHSCLSFALSLAVALAPAAQSSSLDVEKKIGTTDDGRTRRT